MKTFTTPNIKPGRVYVVEDGVLVVDDGNRLRSSACVRDRSTAKPPDTFHIDSRPAAAMPTGLGAVEGHPGPKGYDAMQDTLALRLDGQVVPPFRIFDPLNYEASGELDDAYFAGRYMFGDAKSKNADGTIKTLDDALLIRHRMAGAYKCHDKTLQIHDATGNRVNEKFIDERDRAFMLDFLNKASARHGWGGNAPARSYPAGYQPGQTMCADRPEKAAVIAAWAARDDLKDESSLWPPGNS